MKQLLKLLVLSMCMLIAMPAFSASPSDKLGQCMTDSLNGKERRDLAKWIFFSMAAHPQIKPYLKATPKQIQSSDKYIGHLITRLLTVDCPKQLRAAYDYDPAAVGRAFRLVGRVAMQELMTNKKVMKAITNYMHYANKEKIQKVLTGK